VNNLLARTVLKGLLGCGLGVLGVGLGALPAQEPIVPIEPPAAPEQSEVAELMDLVRDGAFSEEDW
jgi:hypothetical protein